MGILRTWLGAVAVRSALLCANLLLALALLAGEGPALAQLAVNEPITYKIEFKPDHKIDLSRPYNQQPYLEAVEISTIVNLRFTLGAEGAVTGTAKLTDLWRGIPEAVVPLTGTFTLGWCQLNAGKRFSFEGVCAPLRIIGVARVDGRRGEVFLPAFNLKGTIAAWVVGRMNMPDWAGDVRRCDVRSPQVSERLAAAAAEVNRKSKELQDFATREWQTRAQTLEQLDYLVGQIDLDNQEAMTVYQARVGFSIYGRAVDDRYVWANSSRSHALQRAPQLASSLKSETGRQTYLRAVQSYRQSIAYHLQIYDDLLAGWIREQPEEPSSILTLAAIEPFAEVLQACAAEAGVTALRSPVALAEAAPPLQPQLAATIRDLAAGASTAGDLELRLGALKSSKLFIADADAQEAFDMADGRLSLLKTNEARREAARREQERAALAANAARLQSENAARLAQGLLGAQDILDAVRTAHLDIWDGSFELAPDGSLIRRAWGVAVQSETFDVSNVSCSGTAPRVRCRFTLATQSVIFGLPMPVFPETLEHVFEIGPGTRVRSAGYRAEVEQRMAAAAAGGSSVPGGTSQPRAFGSPFERALENHACGKVC